MLDIEINEKRVEKLLKDLKENTSAGPDLSPRILKPLAEIISKPLTIIFRESVKRHELPLNWKIAWITVIYKQGNRALAGNYRPVSLTSVLCKLLEKIIRDHIVQHMVSNQLFSEKQFGFIKGRSTVLQLIRALEEWTEALDTGKAVDCIYADFKKAFDKVPHRRLLKKIRSYGISEDICLWIEEFLKARKQQVKVNGKSSQWEEILSGIPQGTVLGPILFLLYINDLPELVASLLFLIADDSKIWRTIDNLEDITTLQEDLQIMFEWSKQWLLEFHPDKLKHLHIAKDHTNPSYNYHLGDIVSKITHLEKDLGIFVDSSLNFEDHISTKVKKGNSMMGMIRRSFRFLNMKTFLPLYKALVRSGLEYGEAIWSPYKMKDIEKIEGVQRRATKVVPGLGDKPYEERLKILNLPTLRHRRLRGDMIETYKIIHGIYDKKVAPDLKLKKNMRNSTGRRGHSLELFQPRTRLQSSRNIFTNRVWRGWNSLTEHIVTAPSVNAFKARLDRHWKGNPAVYNYKLSAVVEFDDTIRD